MTMWLEGYSLGSGNRLVKGTTNGRLFLETPFLCTGEDLNRVTGLRSRFGTRA